MPSAWNLRITKPLTLHGHLLATLVSQTTILLRLILLHQGGIVKSSFYCSNLLLLFSVNINEKYKCSHMLGLTKLLTVDPYIFSNYDITVRLHTCTKVLDSISLRIQIHYYIIVHPINVQNIHLTFTQSEIIASFLKLLKSFKLIFIG